MKLTVLQILPALHAGGVERGTVEVANELVRRGHRSIVISAGGQLVEELGAGGSEHIMLPVGKKSLSGLLLVNKLVNLIESNEVDILHARSRFPAWISYLAWSFMEKKTRPKFITSVHGPYSVNFYSKIMTRGERVIAISKFIRDYIQENYVDVDMKKVRLVPRGINPDQFPYAHKPSATWLSKWQEEQPQLKNSFVITLPARITRWKGQEDFINLIAKLNKAQINVHGFMAGGVEPRRTAYQRELESLVTLKGIGRQISFLGHRQDLREIMSISNIVISLSNEPEAFGRTSLEALGLGVPVIAYNHGGASEVLEKIFPQGLVDVLDVDGASKRALEFHNNMPIVPNIKPFTLQDMLDNTLEVYQELSSPQLL